MFKIHLLVTALAFASSTSVALAQALPAKAPAPANNPTTSQKVALGQILFHDPRMSSSGTVSCASCHNTMLGGEDNRGGSVGVGGQVGGRSAPTVWNAAFNAVQFWDGRAVSLEDQAAGPVTNPIEMGMKNWDDVVKRLKSIKGYEALFEKAFGKNSISKDNATKAIAAYERTLITPNSAFDKYVKGDKKALTGQQIRGMNLAVDIGCTGCHSGPAFNGPGTFQKFPVISNGSIQAQFKLKKDKGLAEVTGKKADEFFWKVPTLRNIALTAPYFHNGKVKTLDRAVKIMAKMQLGKDLSNDEADDIVAFLGALTGEFPKQSMPVLPAYSGKTFN
ncbi:MAG: c-type cytochrome [Methylococcales symbiont of Hymedesmia sp. n. MRB-2018]|nr:MAG: c-type cytochrome [Methylococcales symbiont of Hymedesmia sp. n. MRB-2018]KAF3983549.1 MAG: c-type cytochrome [Methylococcales symbiont of Hymedesmia sp. n. MRB-2018]